METVNGGERRYLRRSLCSLKHSYHLWRSSSLSYLYRYLLLRVNSFFLQSLSYLYRYLLLRVNSFLFQLLYFVSLSFIGFCVLKSINCQTTATPPRRIDLIFTSVSAATVSSMSTVEMEVFSNSQLIVLTVLMFMGGEVFTSMVGLHLKKRKLKLQLLLKETTSQLSVVVVDAKVSPTDLITIDSADLHQDHLTKRYLSIRFLGYLVLAYLVVVQALGIALVSIYLKVVSSARNVLRQKGLKPLTFSIFTVVSTFTSCGFVPTNENMIVFRSNSGLLLLLIPQILMGNTLFPSCLRFCLWVLGKFTKRQEVRYLLKNSTGMSIRYLHLLPKLHSSLLVVTVLGFIGLQLVLFCAMEWTSEQLIGLSTYEKIVGILFQCVNSRHTGESIVDLSTIAPAVVVLFVVMMYLPPYTSFLPAKVDSDDAGGSEGILRTPRIRRELLETIQLSQLSYIVIFIILVCITERENIKKDPLNFNVFNIVVEIISAYGNVGFTMGYSCKRQLNPDGGCIDKWFGFCGKWSDEGKIVLILVMVFGRLKKFNMNGGRGWKLL